MKLKFGVPLLFGWLGLPIAGFAQVTFSATSYNDGTLFDVSGANLLRTNLLRTDVSGTVYNEFTNNVGVLYDGSFGNTNSGTGAFLFTDGSASFGLKNPGDSITFNFDLSSASNGFSLTDIKTYSAWDQGRDGQYYSVSYSTVSNPSNFISLLTTDKIASDGPPYGSTGTAMVVISQTGGGFFANNVAALRFTFPNDGTGETFENGGTAFREFVVQGSVSAIPEPLTTAQLFGLIALAGTVCFKAGRRGRAQ